MAEEGRGQRHSAPKGCPVAGQPFKSFDNAPRRTKRQKGHCMELQGGALFWFSPKFTPSKIFEPRKFFPRSHFFANKNFSLFKQKISAKSFALSTPESVQKKPFSNGKNG